MFRKALVRHLALLAMFFIGVVSAYFSFSNFPNLVTNNTVTANIEVVSKPTPPTSANVLHIDRAKPFDPLSLFPKDEPWKVLEQDERALAISEIDLTNVDFKKCIKRPDESSFTDEEKLRRLKASGDIRLDAQVLRELWVEKGHKTLNWIYKEKGIHTITFMGTIFGFYDLRMMLVLHKGLGSDWRLHPFLLNLESYEHFSTPTIAK